MVEDGTDIADAAVIWDFTDPEMLLESGVAPNAQGQLWSGWQFHTSKIDLTPWKGKKYVWLSFTKPTPTVQTA